jgi:hypothetical protein
MTAINLLADGTIKASWLILESKGHDLDEIANSDKLSELTKAIKDTLKAQIGQVMGEWEKATEARIGEAWLRKMMNAQANELAHKALAKLTWA